MSNEKGEKTKQKSATTCFGDLILTKIIDDELDSWKQWMRSPAKIATIENYARWLYWMLAFGNDFSFFFLWAYLSFYDKLWQWKLHKYCLLLFFSSGLLCIERKNSALSETVGSFFQVIILDFQISRSHIENLVFDKNRQWLDVNFQFSKNMHFQPTIRHVSMPRSR